MKALTSLLFLVFVTAAEAQQKPVWIWYPGDMEVWLGNKMQNRRTERGVFMPPFWKLDSHYVLMSFYKKFTLPAEETITLYTEGAYNAKLDNRQLHAAGGKITIPAGQHALSLKVFCQDRVPAVYVQGKQLVSDTSWKVTFEDKEWIDETGKVSDKSGTTWLQAASWGLDNPQQPPSAFRLAVTPQRAVRTEKLPRGVMVDFGKETFGYIRLHGLKGKGTVSLYYGESPEEARATETCETLDRLPVDRPSGGATVLTGSRAFRYVNVQYDGNIRLDSVSMLYEYLPLAERGKFRCSDEQVNRIWDVAAYTLHLNTREFFIDGIKRDRWIWSGDAYQSYLMNYYLFFDAPSVTRTLLALRGKDPVTSHINTIMDYTFYWFMGIYDYYRYTGDKAFIRQCYPRMQSLMDFCLSRRNSNGMLEGLAGDWVFIDWADGLSKRGEVSFEQLLFCRSLETMALCAALAQDTAGAGKYRSLAADLRSKLFSVYWNADKHALVHSRVDGVTTVTVTRYANMFAIFFGYLDEQQQQEVKRHVLLNDSIQRITTPYMRFYELEALCAMGEQSYVLKEMKEYWGGMLRLGATSFWEQYDPAQQGAAHYAMYGRPFGKSLCHAWGASPIYLLGKYYLGVQPLSPGYATYSIKPALGGLQWIDGTVPAPGGDIRVYCSTKEIRVQSPVGTGTLQFRSSTRPVCKNGVIRDNGKGLYEITIDPDKEYIITYKLPL